ncbi:unnamed protein product, partial [Rotaria sp. Silwood2]
MGVCANATWAQHGQTVAGGNGRGSELSHLNLSNKNNTIFQTET